MEIDNKILDLLIKHMNCTKQIKALGDAQKNNGYSSIRVQMINDRKKVMTDIEKELDMDVSRIEAKLITLELAAV
jgi:hypothetical protein